MHAIMLRLESISVLVASAAGKKRYVNNLMKNIFYQRPFIGPYQMAYFFHSCILLASCYWIISPFHVQQGWAK